MHEKSTIRIPLNSKKYPGLHAIIDKADYDLVSQYSWHPLKGYSTFYARGGQNVLMHRIINQTPAGMETDHINGDGLDNRRENLRSVESSQNIANAHTPIRASTGNIGVRYDSDCDKPYAATVRGARLGRFSTPEEAAREVDRYRRVIWGDHVRLNSSDKSVEAEGVIRGYAPKKEYSGGKLRGISFDKSRQKWSAEIVHNRVKKKIGYFVYRDEAAAAYDQARIERGLKPVNFPDVLDN